ncbi:MAG: hypothetical protein AB7G76_10210 [Steroidobacteraceae bacterium]
MEGTTCARVRVAALVLCCQIAGCAALAPPAPAAAPGHWYAHAWTLPQCPSSPAAPAFVPTLLAGAAADLVLDRIAAALAAAATADRDGAAWSGADARYLWFGQAAGGAPAGAPAAALAGCVIVALTGSDGADPSAWCPAHDAAGERAPAFEQACSTAGRRLLESASRATPGTARAAGHALPRLYAEIRLRPSRDGAAITPEVLALHYPQALQPRRAATRDLAFTLQLRLPDAAKGVNLFVLLRDVTPGQGRYDPATDLARHESLWSAAPEYPGRKLVPADLGEAVGPANIVLEIRETGDTNAFLQAFAAAFAGFRPALAKALK